VQHPRALPPRPRFSAAAAAARMQEDSKVGNCFALYCVLRRAVWRSTMCAKNRPRYCISKLFPRCYLSVCSKNARCGELSFASLCINIYASRTRASFTKKLKRLHCTFGNTVDFILTLKKLGTSRREEFCDSRVTNTDVSASIIFE